MTGWSLESRAGKMSRWLSMTSAPLGASCWRSTEVGASRDSWFKVTPFGSCCRTFRKKHQPQLLVRGSKSGSSGMNEPWTCSD